ncbi:MAG: AbrB/MazE/SpoVT family DNA-binding domain-containing protein [Candidatus Riflebacteria bacterium]|nr:AbrB/MazE/SpoVT family DNA-binding domain-containing protein [Candidatus Riflebacteria bacterium]
MLTTVTTKGQITIPVKIRNHFHIQPNDKIDFLVEEGRIVIVPVKSLKDLRGSVKNKYSNKLLSERELAKITVARRVKEETE